MRLKTFYAKTMTEAMRQVRDTLGDDAVIIATRDEPGGVSVTAAIEQMDSLPDPYPDDYESTRPWAKKKQAEDSSDWLQYDSEQDFEGQIAEDLTDIMLRHVVPDDVMDRILSTAAMTGMGESKTAMSRALEHLYRFAPLPQKGSRKALMLVGPPGAGKTLFTAKLATQAVMNDLNVAVITTDTVRAGGVEQLQAFTKILKIPLEKAKTQEELKSLLLKLKGHDLILIDTAGTNPHDPDDMARIARLIDSGAIEPVLTLAAGTDAEESSEISRSFALLGVRRMIATRLDVARRFGGLLAAAERGQMAFCNISFTPMVTDGLDAIDASKLAEFLISPDRVFRAKLSAGKNRSASKNQTSQKTKAGRA